MKRKKNLIFAASLAMAISINIVPNDLLLNSAVAAKAEENVSHGAVLALIKEEPPCLFGDMNDDNCINVLDLTLLKRHILDSAAYDNQADLDGDGDNDACDAAELCDYLLAKRPSLTVYGKYDTDSDGLNNYLETLAGTDCRKQDSDGDGLSDGMEIYLTGSDPAVFDSIKHGVSDADTDIDSDGLTNAEEIQIGSNPVCEDSDMDGLNDGTEQKTLHTNPINPDTDEDGLNDYEETELQLNPLNPATDGTLDQERIFSQMIPADSSLLKEINTEENAYELSVEIEAAGCAKTHLSVSKSRFSYVLKDGSALGIAPELTYEPNLQVKKVTLHFSVKEPFRDNVSHWFSGADGDEYEIDPDLDGIRRLNVFRYFEGINTAVPVYTEFDEENAVVSFTMDAFETDENGNSYGIGSFSLVDLEVWGALMNDSEETAPAVAKPSMLRTGITNSSQDEDEKEGTIRKTIRTINANSRELIESNYQRYVRPKALEDTSFGTMTSGTFGHTYARIDKAGMNWAEAKEYCEKLGGHLAVITSASEEAIIERLTAPGKRNNYWLGGTVDGNKICWVTGEPVSYTHWAPYQPDNTEETRLMIYRVNNPCVGPATMLQWNDIRPDGSFPGQPFFGSQNFGFICEWESGAKIRNLDGEICTVSIGGGVPTALTAPLRPASTADTDGDGIPDWDEIDHNAIKKLGGSASDTCVSWNSVQEYGNKALKQSAQAIDKLNNRIKKVANSVSDTTPTKMDTQSGDSDGDGIPDGVDNSTLKGYYDLELRSIIIGELTIISCSDLPTGHGFQIYKSYVNDTLDFTELTHGYVFNESEETWESVDPCFYTITPGDSVSIGNAGLGAGASSSNSQLSEMYPSGDDGDEAGVFFNREFAVEYGKYQEHLASAFYWMPYNQAYGNNYAYTKKITDTQLKKDISWHKLSNYYNLLVNNCAQLAAGAWNWTFQYQPSEQFDTLDLLLPIDLMEQIRNKPGSYRYEMLEVLGLEN